MIWLITLPLSRYSQDSHRGCAFFFRQLIITIGHTRCPAELSTVIIGHLAAKGIALKIRVQIAGIAG